MPKHFLFLQPESKMCWWISIKKNTEKMRFLPFSATRWGWNHSETPFSDSQRPIAPIDTPYPTLYLFGVRNCDREPVSKKNIHIFFIFAPKYHGLYFSNYRKVSICGLYCGPMWSKLLWIVVKIMVQSWSKTFTSV